MEQRDWRIESGYPQNGTPRQIWAWEFLRRNPEYRQQWAAILPRYLNREGEFRDGTPQPPRPLLAPERRYTPNMLWVSTVMRKEHEDTNSPEFRLWHELAWSSWSLRRGYINPAVEYPKFAGQLDPMIFVEDGLYPVDITFFLARPIERQLKTAATMLRDLQDTWRVESREPGRRREKHWRLYLRLLDATEEGLSARDFADELARRAEPGSKRDEGGLSEEAVSRWLRQANRLIRPEGYLTML